MAVILFLNIKDERSNSSLNYCSFYFLIIKTKEMSLKVMKHTKFG